MRLAQIDDNAGGGMIAPGTDGVEIAFQLGVVQIGGDPFPRELHVPMGVEHLDHQDADAQGVDAAPGLRAIVEQLELGGKRIRVLGDEEVDAAGVVVKAGAVGPWQVRVDAPGRQAKLKDALGLVVPDERGAEDLRELAVGVAAGGVHLPQAVLGGYIALGQEEVVLGGRVDVGHAVGVAADGYGRREAGPRDSSKVNVAIEHGQRSLFRRTKPQHACGRGQQHERQQACDEREQNPRPAAFAAAGNGSCVQWERLICGTRVSHWLTTE